MNTNTEVQNGSPDDLNIPLIAIEIKEIATDYYTILFERPQGLLYESGDWLDIRFPISELSIGRTYSFASSPTEPNIMIAFKKGISLFKQELIKVSPGDKLFITQTGSNGFRFNPRYQSLFIAGGIGITPFRSMVKHAIDTGLKTNITLLYINRTEDIPFKEEFEEWSQAYPYLRVDYWITSKKGRLTRDALEVLIPNIPDKTSYIAGSPGMVSSIEDIIRSYGTKKAYIKTDNFTGY
jgi:ferredoxin-NADP reductase